MPDGPAAPEVRRIAALMTEPSKASNIMEFTRAVGALPGSKAAESIGAAAGCLDFKMSYTLPEPGMRRTKVGEQQQFYLKTSILQSTLINNQ